MKRLILLLAFIATGASIAFAQSGYGGDGKTSGDSSVASYIRLYETAPTAATTALAGAGAGNVDNGAHLVKITCYTPGGQTTGGTASNSTTVADKTANGKIAISSIPTCSSVATGRKVYMTTAGGSTYYLLSNGTIANNTTTTLTANDSDATLTASTALPSSNTALDTRLTIGQSSTSAVVPIGTTASGTAGAPASFISGTDTGWFISSSTYTVLTTSHGGVGSGFGFSQTGMNASDGRFLRWAQNGAVAAPVDAGIGRNGTAGLIEFNSGTAGATRDWLARNGTLGHGTPAAAIGTGPTHGQNISFLTGEESLTIAAAATTDTTMQIPAGAVVLSVNVRVTTVIPTAATFTVTGATSGTAFNTAAVSTAANTTDVGTAAGSYYNATAQKIRITPNAVPGAATGVVRVTVVYYVITPPTS